MKTTKTTTTRTLKTIDDAQLARVTGGNDNYVLISDEGGGGGGGGDPQATWYPICGGGQIGMDPGACGGDIIGVVWVA